MTLRPAPAQLAVFDTETTSPLPEQARIVSAFIGIMDVATGQLVERYSWLLNPGVEIPQGAIDVHGITNEIARTQGTDAKRGIFDIMQRIDIIDKRGIPLVIYNCPFDLSLLEYERQRYWPGMRPVTPQVVIDPLVLWKAVDRYRKGKRTLVTAAEAYGVPVAANAHDAEADCVMAGLVAIKVLEDGAFDGLTPLQVHKKTIPTYRDQALGLAEYFRGKGAQKAAEEELAAALEMGYNLDEARAKASEVRASMIAKADGVDTGWPYRNELITTLFPDKKE